MSEGSDGAGRTGAAGRAQRWEPRAEPIRLGGWRVDPRADEISKPGTTIKLEPLKMRLLLALAERPGEVVLTQELLDRVWGDVIVTSASVYQGIAQLRRLLGDDADPTVQIETVPRKGYRLVAEVAAVPLAEPARPEGVSAPPAAASSSRAASPDRRRWLAAAAGVLAAGAGALAGWRLLGDRRLSLPVRLAVLPFVDRTAGAAEPALCQQLAFDVIRAFERYPDTIVAAPDSALRAAGGSGSRPEMAQRLGADLLLDGELLGAQPRARIAVRLIATSDNGVVWQKTFEQPAESLPALPTAIAIEAAAAMRLPNLPVPAAAMRPTDAYELYVLGNNAWRPKTSEAFAKARDYFQRGIEVDPGYSRNYIGLGWMWLGQASAGAGLDLREGIARATPLFEKAARLEPDSAEVLTAQGLLRSEAGQFDAARVLFDRAAAANPGYAQVHHSRGVAEFEDGWPERAAAHFRRAVELNPLSASPLERLALALVTAGHLGEAEAVYRKAIALEPAYPNGDWGLGIKGYAQGALDEAVAGYREALRKEPRRANLWAELSYLYVDLGAAALAADAMARAQALLPRAAWLKAMAGYAWLAEPDRREPPPAVALRSADRPDDDDSIVDAMTVRAMAGLPVDAELLQRRVAFAESAGQAQESWFWNLFLGFDRALDLATLYAITGRPEQARALAERAEQRLARYERQGNAWHMLAFHRARAHALLGRRDAALASLKAAIAAGCRRGWRLRLDPAFASLRDSSAFADALARIDAEIAPQRRRLGI